MKYWKTLVLVVSLALVTTACGEEEIPSVSFAAQNETPMSQLEEGDWEQICEELTAHFLEPYHQIYCTVQGIVVKAQGGDCEPARTTCVSKRDAAEGYDECIAAITKQDFSQCTNTVGQFETCLNDYLHDSLGSHYFSLDCSSQPQYAPDDTWEITEPESCERVSAECIPHLAIFGFEG